VGIRSTSLLLKSISSRRSARLSYIYTYRCIVVNNVVLLYIYINNKPSPNWSQPEKNHHVFRCTWQRLNSDARTACAACIIHPKTCCFVQWLLVFTLQKCVRRREKKTTYMLSIQRHAVEASNCSKAMLTVRGGISVTIDQPKESPR
jgi:hypothetical protein